MPKIDREERFKRLEAKQREKEGLALVGVALARWPTPPTTTPPYRQRILESNNESRKSF